MLRFLSASCLLVCLVGCSSIPDVAYNYYFVKSDTTLSVAQTVTCDAYKANLIFVTTASPPAMAYSADLARGPQLINIRAIEGNFQTFVDSDAKFEFYDDGRLKSINQNTVGQGESAIKSAVSLATTIVPMAAAIADLAEIDECKVVDKLGADKGVNLTYSAQFDITHVLGRSFSINPSPASKELYKKLNAHGRMPPIDVSIGNTNSVGGRATFLRPAGYSDDDIVGLKLQKTANVEIKIYSAHRPIWKGSVIVPMQGTYTLPIPKAALFGKQSFSLALSEAGAVQSIDYGKLSGATGALNAAGSIATASAPEATSAKVADIKAQADLIAQTQRLARCHTNPVSCN